MKKLLALLLVVSTLSFAEQKDYTLPIESIDNQTEKINFIPDDWEYVTEVDRFKILVEKGALGLNEDHVNLYTVTIFNKLTFFSFLQEDIDKIYTYGVLNCNNKSLDIYYDLYVGQNQNIVYRSYYSYGFNINLNEPNSIKIDILNTVCNKSI